MKHILIFCLKTLCTQNRPLIVGRHIKQRQVHLPLDIAKVLATARHHTLAPRNKF